MTAIAKRPTARGVSPTADLVAEAGRLLYGAQWATPLTKALLVDRRELRRWMAANPANPVTHKALVALRDLLLACGTFDAKRLAARAQKILDEDHGSGGPIMLSGSAVKGGLAGEHPGVNVDQDGDLVVKTDFRTVYQSLIAEWLGGDPHAILPGGPFDGIHRYDGGTALMKAA